MQAYTIVMTAKHKKTKRKPTRARARRIGDLRGSAEEEFLSRAEDRGDARWSRPRKQRICVRVDVEVVDWLKSQGTGYQTRINRILRRAMAEGKRKK